MKNPATFLTVGLLVVFFNTELAANGLDITFTANGIIQEGDDYDDVWVYDTPPDITTVNMTGGEVAVLHAYNQSITNIKGGLVATSCSYEQSTINISAGIVQDLIMYDGGSLVNMTGGKCWNVSVGRGVFDISGGEIISLLSANSGWATVNIYGYDFSYDPWYTPNLTGFWRAGTPFGLNFNVNNNSYEAVVLHEIPDHATLTIIVEPNDVGIDTITPGVGPHDYAGVWVSIRAERFINCPDVYTFDHWAGDVNDANSANTTVFMDSDKTITAVFVDDRQCGDECHPYPSGDVSKDCKVDFLDIAMVASSWLECTRPECD